MDIQGKPILPPATANSVNTDPAVDKAAEAAPPPAPDQFKPPNNEAPPPAPPPPPAGLPVAGPNVEPNVLEDGRRILREAIEDDDTDDLARFLRELRNNNSPTVVRGVAIMLFQEAGQQHDKGGMSTELFLKIKELIDTTLRGVPPTI